MEWLYHGGVVRNGKLGCGEALRLGRRLVQLLSGESEVHALLALMELNASRTAARRGSNGEAVLLPDQDGSLWDVAQIQPGMTSLGHAQRPGGEADLNEAAYGRSCGPIQPGSRGRLIC